MDPSYKQIADLFGLVAPFAEEPVEDENKPKKLKGDTAEESTQLGSEELKQGHFEAAIKHFKRSIEQRDPADVTGRVDLAGAYEIAEMAPQALVQYQKAIEIRGDAAEPHLGIAQLHKREGKWKESAEEIERALELEPGNAFYHHKLAELYREYGDRKRALVAAQGAVRWAPTESFYHYWVGDLLIEMGRFQEALDALRAAIELSPGDDHLYLRAAVAFWGSGKRQEAVKSVRLASDLDPETHLYHGVLELFLSEMGFDEEADLEAERAGKMDSYDRERLRRLAAELDLVE